MLMKFSEFVAQRLNEEDDNISHYHIVNHRTGKVVGKASTKHGARRAVDRHDNKYGGYAHRIVPVHKDGSSGNSVL